MSGSSAEAATDTKSCGAQTKGWKTRRKVVQEASPDYTNLAHYSESAQRTGLRSSQQLGTPPA